MLHLLTIALLSDGVSSLRVRGLALIGFVLALFVVAGLMIWLGQRAQAAKHARALSADTGSEGGAVRGGDQTASSDWLTEVATADGHDASRTAWQDAFLAGEASGAAPVAAPGGTPVYPQVRTVSRAGARRADVPVDSPSAVAAPVEYVAPVPPVAAPIEHVAPVPPVAAPIEHVAPVPPVAAPVEYVAPVPPVAAPVEYVAPVPPVAAPIEHDGDEAHTSWWRQAVAEDDRSA